MNEHRFGQLQSELLTKERSELVDPQANKKAIESEITKLF